MISEVDDALRELVRTEALAESDVEVVFDAPTKDWAARRNAPTVNLYLYDIREDLRRRELGWSEVHDEDGIIIGRRPAPRFFKMSYLLTAWTQRPEDEHRLLDNLLRTFLLYDALPKHLVTGRLAEPRLDVPLTIGRPPPEDRAFADVWSALGGELKPSLDLVVDAPVDRGIVYPAGPPVDDGIYLDVGDTVDGGQDNRAHRHTPPPPTNGAPKSAASGSASGKGKK
ncbi:DUF4255 domain-containing protein [Nocardioides speluncae]|uniref:DUF4255 domain-containing protein n=1 Tax=Nocardioides speluncae TaxID=2670337 RepID=UPI000D687AC3|nr:DUF4255 domain-containing protein [Nocardioides speluncae]